MARLSAGLSLGFCVRGIDKSSEFRDSGRNSQSFYDVLASGLMGIVPLLVSAEPAFFLGLLVAERLLDNDRRPVVHRSGIGS